MKCNILHKKEDCIGCGVCAALDPNNWEMEAEGKSHLKESEEQEGNEKKKFEEKELKKNKETAESCPVNVIHLYKHGKQIL